MKSPEDLIYCKRVLQPNLWCYYQLFQNTMLAITDRSGARLGMLDLCFNHLSDGHIHLTEMKDFAKTYRPTQAVYWFTRDSFIHRTISRVLRTGNIEQYSLLRLYISDLSKQLIQLKRQQQTLETNTLLYRGLRQSEAHLKTLRNLVGRTISVKDFMSTSRDIEVAACYAGVFDPQTSQSQPLLIEVHVDMARPEIIAADIAHLSKFPDEREVLFDIGSKFRIEWMKYQPMHSTWYCRLVAISSRSPVTHFTEQGLSDMNFIDLSAHHQGKATSESITRQRAFKIAHHYRDNDPSRRLPSTASWIAHTSKDRARILQEKALAHWHENADIHQFYSELKNAWRVFNRRSAHDTVAEGNDTACFLNNLGYAYQQLKFTEHAISLLEEASELRQQLGASEHFRAQSLRNLGLAYTDLGDHESAFTSLEQALSINQQASPTAQWSTSMTLRNLSYLYHAKGDYVLAAKYCCEALETLRECENVCMEYCSIYH